MAAHSGVRPAVILCAKPVMTALRCASYSGTRRAMAPASREQPAGTTMRCLPPPIAMAAWAAALDSARVVSKWTDWHASASPASTIERAFTNSVGSLEWQEPRAASRPARTWNCLEAGGDVSLALGV